MRTLLVDLDNHAKVPPHRALWPIPDSTVGAALMRLIAEHTGEPYRPGDFVTDFARTHMYPMRRAPNGKGKIRSDRDAIQHVMFTANMVRVNDIVLIGSRIRAAFNSAYKCNMAWMESAIVESHHEIRRVWAIPYPDKRFEQFRIHREAMGKLLTQLRDRPME